MKTIFLASALLLSSILPASIKAQTITVGQGGDYPTLSAASNALQPGDTCLVLDGVYSDGTQWLESVNGTSDLPIIIMAANEHNAVFKGGTEAIHLVNCSHVVLDGFVIREQTGNGINIDDGGDYDTPTHHIVVMNCIFEDIDASGNNDFLKLSGLDSFLVKGCWFTNGAAGSGVDMVGCHDGVIEDNHFNNSGNSGVQAKGGTQYIRIQRNMFRDIDQRAINIGGSTGLQFFRPPLPDTIVNAFESADIEVYSNIFIGSWSPIAFVGTVNSKVRNNTFYKPENWVFRILQETTVPGFLTCADNEFSNNIIYLESELTEVNVGPNTAPETFTLTNNLWFNESSTSWSPNLPVTDPEQIIEDPQFADHNLEDFHLQQGSPCIGNGAIFNQPDTDFESFLFLSPPSIGALEGGDSMTPNKEEQGIHTIRAFPNPFKDVLIISGDLFGKSMQLLDKSGRLLIESDELQQSNLFLQTGDLPPGPYFVIIGQYRFKLIKTD